jgi:hypothetical protein
MIKPARKAQLPLLLLAAMSILCIATVAARDEILTAMAKYLEIERVSSEISSEVKCNETHCLKEYSFSTSGQSYFGMYGFNAMACSKDAGNLCGNNSIKANYYQFRIWPTQPGSRVNVSAYNIKDTPRIGSSAPSIFLGKPENLESLRKVYDFISIHIYLVQAWLFLFVTALIASSSIVKTRSELIKITFLGLSGALVQLIFSHYFTAIFFDLGIGFDTFLATCRSCFIAFFGFLAFRPRRVSIWLIFVASYFLLTTLSWPGQSFLSSYSYRWLIAALSIAITTRMLLRREWLHALVTFIVTTHDVALMFNLPISNGKNSILALGIFPIFLLEHSLHVKAFITNNIQTLHRKIFEEKLAFIGKHVEQSSLDTSIDTAITYFTSNYGSMSCSVLLTWDGITLHRSESSRCETTKLVSIPPVFARTIQATEEMWWKDDQFFDGIRAFNKAIEPRDLKGTVSAVLPLEASGRAFGAISVSLQAPDFKATDQEFCQWALSHLRNSITRWCLASQQVQAEESSHKVSSYREHSVRICSGSNSFESATASLVEYLCQVEDKKCVTFKVNSDKTLTPAYFSTNFPNRVKNIWEATPFVARVENKLGPIPIAYTERKDVIIESISAYYPLLSSLSVQLLSNSETYGLSVFPCFFDGLELVHVFLDTDDSPHPAIHKDGTRSALSTLQFYYEHFRVRDDLTSAENILTRFAPLSLQERLRTSSADARVLVGEVVNSSMLLFDIRGSTLGSTSFDDPHELAVKYSTLYADAADIALTHGARFEKSNGDGIVLTKPVSEATSLAQLAALIFDSLRTLEIHASKNLHASGVMCVLHQGCIFQGVFGNSQRVGWENYGSDLNAAFDIEKQAKKIHGCKLAISHAFRCELEAFDILVSVKPTFVPHSVGSKKADFYAFDGAQAQALSDIFSVSLKSVA